MISLSSVKELATKNELVFEESTGSEYLGEDITPYKIKVESGNSDRYITFYEWYEKPFKTLTPKRFGEVKDMRNKLPSINAAYWDGYISISFDKGLRYRLYEETLNKAFEWLMTGNEDDLKIISKKDTSIRKEHNFQAFNLD